MARLFITFALIGAAVCLTSCGGNSQDTSSTQSAPKYFASSAYVAADYKTTVQQLYMAYLGRPADPNGLQYFSANLATTGIHPGIESVNANYSTNQTVKWLVDSFASSNESAALYLASDSTTSFVNSVYNNVLGRAPALPGLLFWSNAIDSGGLSKPKAAMSIMMGALANTSTQGLADATLIQNRTTVASAFTEALTNNGESGKLAYMGAAAATKGRLTLGSVSATLDPSTIPAIVDCAMKELGLNTLTMPSNSTNCSPPVYAGPVFPSN